LQACHGSPSSETDVSRGVAINETKVPGSADPTLPVFSLLFSVFFFLFFLSCCYPAADLSVEFRSDGLLCSSKNMNDVDDAMIAVKPQPRFLPSTDHMVESRSNIPVFSRLEWLHGQIKHGLSADPGTLVSLMATPLETSVCCHLLVV